MSSHDEEFTTEKARAAIVMSGQVTVRVETFLTALDRIDRLRAALTQAETRRASNVAIIAGLEDALGALDRGDLFWEDLHPELRRRFRSVVAAAVSGSRESDDHTDWALGTPNQ